MAWRDADKLIALLWTDPASKAIFQAVDAAAAAHEVIQTARKGYTAWSRKVQFAAARPVKGGKVMLGLALAPTPTPASAPRNEDWSERLKSRTLLSAPAEVNGEIETLLRAAWERS